MKIPVKIIDSRYREEDPRGRTPEQSFARPGWARMMDDRADDEIDNEEVEPEMSEESSRLGNGELKDAVEVSEEAAAEACAGEGEDYKNKYVRMLADFENYKRHAEAERGRLAGIGKEAVLDDLFPLVEVMEMALKAGEGTGNNRGLIEGIQLVYKQLLSVLEKHGVERVPAIGEPFDPKVHEAIAVIESDCPPDTVIEEVRPGFIRAGKLLRPASVVVSK